MPPDIGDVLERIEQAGWDERIEEIRRVPEKFGKAQHAAVYAAVAESFYRPHLSAHFAYVLWSDKYELEPFQEAYDLASETTSGFTAVEAEDLAQAIKRAPRALRVFRTIIGYTTGELAKTASEVAKSMGLPEVGKGRIESMERGSKPSDNSAKACAEAIHRLISGTMWEVDVETDFRPKLDKPDTNSGWETVRQFAEHGVPYSTLLHQRHYGGAFRALTDATSTLRGEALLEAPVEKVLSDAGVMFIKTGAHDQKEIADRFNLTVRPAPDFVIYSGERTLRAMIECKQANDGGTARDKAGRFSSLRTEGARLGGLPVFAVLDGLGWERVGDALGPVVRDTDGRVFSLETLPSMLEVQPFPTLIKS